MESMKNLINIPKLAEFISLLGHITKKLTLKKLPVFCKDLSDLLPIPSHIYCKNREGFYLGCNKFMTETLRLKSEKHIIGKTDSHTNVSQNDILLFRKQDQEVITTNKAKYYQESMITYNFSNPMNFLTIKFPMSDSTQYPIALLGISIVIPIKELSLNKLTQGSEILCVLSKREIECLYFMLRGYSATLIADKLNLSTRTVEGYTNHIKNKLFCMNKTEVIEFIIDRNLIYTLNEAYKNNKKDFTIYKY